MKSYRYKRDLKGHMMNMSATSYGGKLSNLGMFEMAVKVEGWGSRYSVVWMGVREARSKGLEQAAWGWNVSKLGRRSGDESCAADVIVHDLDVRGLRTSDAAKLQK